MSRPTRGIGGAVLMGFVLVACQGSSPSPSASSSAAATTAGSSSAAPSEEPISYPEEPITLVVGFGAGGGLDIVARAIADASSECTDQPITVVNQEGAGGTIAASEVANGEPDGYTAYLGAVANMVAQPHRAGADLGYDSPDDYSPVMNVLYFSQVMAVSPDAPYQTIEEMLEYAEQNPGEITVGSGSEGSLPHLTLEAMKREAGVDITHVPFTGFSESVPAFLGGHIDAVIVTPADMVAHVEAGDAKIIGVFSDERIDVFPDAPTFTESGVSYAQDNYYMVILPDETPEPIVNALHDILKCTIETDEFVEFAENAGATVDYAGPADLKAQMEADYERFGELIPELGL